MLLDKIDFLILAVLGIWFYGIPKAWFRFFENIFFPNAILNPMIL
jgi:hypothetical protein